MLSTRLAKVPSGAAVRRPSLYRCTGVPAASRAVLPRVTCKAASPNGGETSILGGESDAAFLAKLTLVSFVGGAAIKYGSLLPPFSQVPFGESPTLATLIVLLPPLAYTILLLVRGARASS